MANIKSAIKRNRQNEKRRQANKAVRSKTRTMTQNALQAASTDEAEAKLSVAISNIDKAAAKGVIHKNTAARKKSRLTKRVRS